MSAFTIKILILCLLQTKTWCYPQSGSPRPNNITLPTSASLNSIPIGMNASQILMSQIKADEKLSPSIFGGPKSNPVTYPNSYVNGHSNPGNTASLGLKSIQEPNNNIYNGGAVSLEFQRPQVQYGSSPEYYRGSTDNRNPVPFRAQLSSSVGNLGSSVVQSKSQAASQIMDGVAYGISRVPSFIGYGIQGTGRLEQAGEHLFKAAVDLGVGGLSNGIEGLSLGMNVMSGLGNAGMKGITKVANGSAQILGHILSLGVTDSGLFNTLVALGRLLSPSRLSNFSNSGLSMDTLMNAARYLSIPMNNTNLNTLLSAANSLQSSGVNVDSIRNAASAAANSLGLTTAWNILSSRLSSSGNGGDIAQAIAAAATSNNPLPVNGSSVNANVQLGGQGASANPSGTTGGTSAASWVSSWLG